MQSREVCRQTESLSLIIGKRGKRLLERYKVRILLQSSHGKSTAEKRDRLSRCQSSRVVQGLWELYQWDGFVEWNVRKTKETYY